MSARVLIVEDTDSQKPLGKTMALLEKFALLVEDLAPKYIVSETARYTRSFYSVRRADSNCLLANPPYVNDDRSENVYDLLLLDLRFGFPTSNASRIDPYGVFSSPSIFISDLWLSPRKVLNLRERPYGANRHRLPDHNFSTTFQWRIPRDSYYMDSRFPYRDYNAWGAINREREGKELSRILFGSMHLRFGYQSITEQACAPSSRYCPFHDLSFYLPYCLYDGCDGATCFCVLEEPEISTSQTCGVPLQIILNNYSSEESLLSFHPTAPTPAPKKSSKVSSRKPTALPLRQ